MNTSQHTNKKRIAVIGAGAGGLCAAKYLLQAGFDVHVFEIGSELGGLWCFKNDNGRSAAYRTLHINTSRSATRFSDLDFDPDTQAFPDHSDMHRYLTRYAEHFGVSDRVRFRSKVVLLKPDFDPQHDTPRWILTFEDGREESFDRVVAASGHLSQPMHVEMFKSFGGEYLHSFDYNAPEPYVGKRVCIVGVGNSACDIAGDLCATSARCVLVARSGVRILPKLLFGKPFTDISMAVSRPWIPGYLRRKIIGWLTYIAHGDMGKLGFKKLSGERAHVTSNGTLVTDIAYRRVEVKQGITAIIGDEIEFTDGTIEQFDTLIAATGYLIQIEYLAPEVLQVKDNQLDLYQRIALPGWPGLYFFGFFNTDTALNFVYEYQARWITGIETGEYQLPSDLQMRESIAQHKTALARSYRHSPRHTIEEEHVPYISALKASMKAMKNKRKAAA